MRQNGLVIDLNTDLVQFINYHPWPETPLYEDMKNENRLKSLPYRHQHGASELAFVHPHITKAEDHKNYLRQAFRRKYLAGGLQ